MLSSIHRWSFKASLKKEIVWRVGKERVRYWERRIPRLEYDAIWERIYQNSLVSNDVDVSALLIASRDVAIEIFDGMSETDRLPHTAPDMPAETYRQLAEQIRTANLRKLPESAHEDLLIMFEALHLFLSDERSRIMHEFDSLLLEARQAVTGKSRKHSREALLILLEGLQNYLVNSHYWIEGSQEDLTEARRKLAKMDRRRADSKSSTCSLIPFPAPQKGQGV